MKRELSANAKAILDAGIEAGRARQPDPFSAADKAVEIAVGRIAIANPRAGDLDVIDALRQIAQLHVREQLSRQTQ
jgi:hypothetical protein